MKLLVVASGMGVGGAERIAVALARHRREQGDAVTVVAVSYTHLTLPTILRV